MPLKSITFNCEIITPMFCGNATQDAELRPSAIKGALRFWWRAMQNTTDVAKLREEEAAIFGSADEEVGRSKVVVEVEKLTSFNLQLPEFSINNEGTSKKVSDLYLSSNKDFPSNILEYLTYGLHDYVKGVGVVYH